MSITLDRTLWTDPDALTEAAQAFLGSETPPAGYHPGLPAIETALRQAYQRVAADLETLDRRRQAIDAVQVRDLFGTLVHEKTAAVIFLARHLLLDLATAPEEWLDQEYAHRDLTLFTEMLFHLNAIDGLGVLYDFAASRQVARKPAFWQNVAKHCLFLLALLPEERERVIAFIVNRPLACEQLLQLSAATQPAVAEKLHKLLDSCRLTPDALPAAAPPPPYMRVYMQLDQGLPYEAALGTCALISAERHLQRAFTEDSMPELLRWFAAGSPGTLRKLFYMARAQMAPREYAGFLEGLLVVKRAHPVRLTAIMLELGRLNRELDGQGGDAELNRVLAEAAMDPDDGHTGVGRVAVRQLTVAQNPEGLAHIAESAPQLEIAEEAVNGLKEMRRLRLMDTVIPRRPLLIDAYQKAQQELTEVQHLVEAAWSANSEEVTQRYLQRLRDLKAYPELEKFTALTQRHRRLRGE